VLKVLKTNSHPGKKPVLHPACKITNLCPLLRGILNCQNINFGKLCNELGFRYAKINGNKKALVERKDLVNKRIFFLRTIKQKRNEGYNKFSN
jgi:hypothetical protein